ncbi:MMPL family transporter [Methylophaga sp.]|jgi:predicted RND superfamily exporter protein|uniref:efflux RND transporter permease subunit n=1 Tax=Methylophaga sp. TaxID=2024840 RepID=UPI0013FFF72A|nr:MMPL family transporter [Methylophaga sp.]MTI64795.1 hypothetical protein [Methylophaga sp.]
MKKSFNYPRYLIWLITGLCLVAAYFIKDFRFDASEDTLVAEGDPDLAYYRDVSNQFGGEGFLVLTYKPTEQALLSPPSIENLQALVAELEQVKGVSSVDSLLEAPLLQSPHVPVSELATGYRTLLSEDVNLAMAREELTRSPLFRNLLISEDGQTTAIRIQLKQNQQLAELRDERRELRAIEQPTAQQKEKLASVEARYQKIYSQHLEDREALISDIRSIRDDLSDEVVAYLGGVPMIAADMISYVKQDVLIFGVIVIAIISMMLFWLFRQWRWVLFPLASTGVTIFLTTGILGFLQQPTTVVSSNYISLLTIFSISFAIHLIVRYRELGAKNTDMPHQDLVLETMKDKLAPCVYMALTTMVAFGSLVTSDIVPVMDFGWIMSIGILVSFLVTYALFAGILLLLPRSGDSARLHDEPRITQWLSTLAVNHTRLILGLMLIAFIVAALGIGRLSMDNRFVEYFRDHTEIHKGLEFIDKNLGGTMPMDIILKFPPYEAADREESSFFSTGEDANARLYWFTPNKIQYLREMHDYLDSKAAVGKVISLENLEQVAQTYNDGEPLGPVELVTALKAMPERVYQDLIEPYASPESGMMRISLRLHETVPDYTIEGLIADIENYAVNELGFEPENIRITGMAVLFNGMLQHLFDSQTSTLIFVILATLIMFMLLLRSLTLALVGLIPNVLAAATALGLMGYLGIPLDVMTITIAAIIIGIGVDDAIHYLHRFRKEYAASENVRTAVSHSHQSIGNAIYYTSITVIIGFSVLVFSNFIPSVYFGLMTALAMLLALTANLTLLPGLLILAYQSNDKQRTQRSKK